MEIDSEKPMLGEEKILPEKKGGDGYRTVKLRTYIKAL